MLIKKVLQTEFRCPQNKERVTKAQKRRERKDEKEKARQLDIERQDEENKLGLRHQEASKLKEILKMYNFTLFCCNILNTYNCWY